MDKKRKVRSFFSRHFARKLVTHNYVLIILEYGSHIILVANATHSLLSFASYIASGSRRNDSHPCVVLFTQAKNYGGCSALG